MNGKAEYVEEKFLKHDLQERITHWVHVVDFVLLVLTGFQIRYPSFAVFGSMETARFLHVISGYLFIFLGIVHVYFFFAQGKHKIAMPVPSDAKDLWPTIRYYLFIDGEKPDFAKYNPLQKIAYAALFVVSLVQTILGFALYWPTYFESFIYGLGGLMAVKSWHTLIAWVFVAFTLLHLYLVFSEDIRLVTALINGYYYRKVPRERAES
ncbi:MAG: Ni/Fe-hydrogenase, b-type cytochrome subunit [Deltaproteobacteria bacterium]|nr:MAG: Ni/Fe-hydrogenase, b-type cytochrome subunit [Deltaproteobacteria bacterium]